MRTPYGKLVALTLVLTLALLLIAPMRVDRDEFINLYPQRLHMTAGDTYALETQLIAETPQQVRYSSSNERVAIVSEDGEITAVGAGRARIRADAEGGARAAMNVQVEAALPPSVGLALNAEAMDLEKGQISGLRAIFDEGAETRWWNGTAPMRTWRAWTPSDACRRSAAARRAWSPPRPMG